MLIRVIIFHKSKPVKSVVFTPKASLKYPRDIILEVEAMNLTPDLHDFTEPLQRTANKCDEGIKHTRGDLSYIFDRRESGVITEDISAITEDISAITEDKLNAYTR